MVSNKVLVSIIIPIYNVKDYLKECLDSVINQSYQDLDIVLIDDGSSDGSLNIAKEYAKNDKRIFLITKANGGLSSARNAGLEFIKGTKLREFFENKDLDSILSYVKSNTFEKESKQVYKEDILKHFIKVEENFIQSDLENINDLIIQDLPQRNIHFLDSDDYLFPNCIELCVEKMQEENLDILAHSFKEFVQDDNKFRINKCNLFLKARNLSGRGGLQLLLRNRFYEFYFAWQGIFQAKLLNAYKLRFTYGIYHEDHDFGTILFSLASNFAYIKDELMVYRIRKDSITGNKEAAFPKNLPKNLESLRRHFSDYQVLRTYFKSYCMCVIAFNIFTFFQNEHLTREERKFIKKVCEKYIRLYMQDWYPTNYIDVYSCLKVFNPKFLRFKIMLRLYWRHPKKLFWRSNA